METKQCKTCKQEKPLNCFYIRKETQKHLNECKECRNKKNIENYNKDKKERIKKQKKYAEKHKKEIATYRKEYNREHRKDIQEYNAQYKKIHKDNVCVKLANNLRRRLNSAIDKSQKTGSAVDDLDCSIEQLKIYLELQFYINDISGIMMSWENRKEWHIHHVIPLHTFDLTDEKQFKEAAHYTNLQPLWIKDHIKKHST